MASTVSFVSQATFGHSHGETRGVEPLQLHPLLELRVRRARAHIAMSWFEMECDICTAASASSVCRGLGMTDVTDAEAGEDHDEEKR